MSDKYFQAVGRRKTAIAEVRLTPGGKGNFVVNGKPLDAYFTTEELRRVIFRSLKEVGKAESVDVSVKTVGGGMNGQAGAVSLGLSRALIKLDENLRPALKAAGLLTRDPRKKERKKPGLRGARRAPQWRKR